MYTFRWNRPYTCDPNLEKNEITRNFLWWNDGIMIGNKSIKYKDWCQKGVRFVNDLLTDNGHFLEYTDFCNLYQLNSNILNYYGIVNAIKSKWPCVKKGVSKTLQPFQPMVYDILFKPPKGCRVFANGPAHCYVCMPSAVLPRC